MLLVFGSAKLLAEIAERLGQPAVAGEILAGILIGPSVLGWVRPNDLLHALAELGAMFLLFRVGMEIRASDLLSVGGTALVVATLGVVLPFAAGWGLLRWWGAPQVEAIFVGAAMVATSVGITAHVLASKGLLGNIASRIILAAAVIDDVLGLVVLAIVSSMARGHVNVPEILLTGVLALTASMVIAKWGTRAMGGVMPRLASRLRTGEVQFNLALVVLFALAVLAVYAGVAAIIGAFLAGLVLAESVERRVHDLAQGISELLTPFFLAGIGLHLDAGVFRDRGILMLSALLVVAAVVSKLAGCGLGAVRLGWKTMFRVGAGMVPRGEVGMVVAQIGLTLGVVPKPVYAVTVFMALATTLVAPPLLNLAYRGASRGPAEDGFEPG